MHPEVATGADAAGFGDRLIAIRATLYINHRKKREELAELRDAYAFMMEEDERAVPTEALLKLKNMKVWWRTSAAAAGPQQCLSVSRPPPALLPAGRALGTRVEV